MTKKDGKPCVRCGTSEWYDNGKCKYCQQEHNNRWAKKNPEKVNEIQKRYRERHPDEVRVASQRWRLKNPEKARKSDKNWRENNLQKARDNSKKWHENNRYTRTRQNREWHQNNPDRVKEKRHRRRALEFNAGGQFTAADWKAIVKQQNGRCLACGQKKKLTADHIVPLSRGGSNDASNIQGLCLSCNDSKGTKIKDYRKEGGILRWVQKKLL